MAPILQGLGLGLTASVKSPLTTLPQNDYLPRIPKAPVAAGPSLVLLLLRSFHETFCSPTGGYLGKGNVQDNVRKRLGLFCSLETGLCNRSENGLQVTTHPSESERSLRADGDAGSVREVRARGRIQSRSTQGRLPGGGSFSVLCA